MTEVLLYDTTLRDGAQREGISFSVVDKLKIAERLDELGIDFIEGGWPGSNPKDIEFFERAKRLKLSHARLVAFGSTRHPDTDTESDVNLLALVAAGVGVVTIVGKSSAEQVAQVLETSLEENLRMIGDSIRFLKSRGLQVFFDAEHFFDGIKADKGYALKTLELAAAAGADFLVLCDTNGGSLPQEIASAVKAAKEVTVTPLAIHTHNDAELAVANTLAAVTAGVSQVQGTINGYGERCGNANLCSVIPALKLKMGVDCISDEQMARLTDISRYISEMANLIPDSCLPYVGLSAFTHKAGLHVSALTKWGSSYQHVNPDSVGNEQKVLISELSGRANIIHRARQMGFNLPARGKDVKKLVDQVKLLESRGFQYDHAEASFELLVYRAMADYQPPFELVDFMLVVEKRRRQPTRANHEEMLAEATVKVKVGDEILHTVSEGNGPVNALDQALRQALMQYYPSLSQVRLVDYKVRILEESTGTGSQVRVLIESSDGNTSWRTVGSSTNIIEASWLALADGLEYWLVRQRAAKG
ncbi:MAG: citramalate synthase [Chloroflexota bacterium]